MNRFVCLTVISVVIFFSSCSSTKLIPDGEYLYNKSKIELDQGKIDRTSLGKYQRIRTNKKILGVRFHLGIYNLSNPEKESFPHSWFRKIGEAPILYDSNLVNVSSGNFTKYISNKGYNAVAVVEELEQKGKKKVNVTYKINLGEPTLIKSIKYSFEDTTIQKYVYLDTSNALVKVGAPFDKPNLQAERLRIEALLKNNGFYNFSREYIYYEVNQLKQDHSVELSVNFKQNLKGNINPVTKVRPHKQYKIDKVNIYPNIQKKDELEYDTVLHNQHNLFYLGERSIKASTLVDANRIMPGDLYSLKNYERSYTNFSSLGLFRFINIGFSEQESEDEYGKLNCNVELAMRQRQSYSFEVVLTNSDNDLGVGGNITYNNYNIFSGGEHLQIGFSGGVESLRNRLDADPMQELGVTAKLETPKFLLPFSAEEFQRKYNPRTALQISYNNQSQPNYVRTIVNTSFGYNWKGNSYNKHSIYPVDFYLVKLPEEIDSAYFVDYIEDTRLENSFIDHAILGIRYGFEFSNQEKDGLRDYTYLKTNLESAGPLMNQVDKWSGGSNDSILGVPYFQYVKGDIDVRKFNVLSSRDRLVYRLFVGVGFPYGISDAMPFEKMYWAGGPYGIRAWSERSLGPGSYPDTTANQLGDIKIEANLEHRFKMFWKLEGALFVDAGNVWLLKDDTSRPGAGFHFDTFLDDIAIGTGLGVRFDLSFVLLRLDFGFKLRDPSIQSDTSLEYSGDEPYYTTGSKWTFKNPDVNFWSMSFQFGIGYPF